MIKTEPLDQNISSKGQDMNNTHFRIKRERSFSPIDNNLHSQFSPLQDVNSVIENVKTPKLVDHAWGSVKSESLPISTASIVEGIAFLRSQSDIVKTTDDIPPKGTKICDVCGENIPKRSKFVAHYYEVHNYVNVKKIQCAECGMPFKSFNQLRGHTNAYHQNSDIVKTKDDIPPHGTTSCDICGANITKRSKFIQHYYNVHSYVPVNKYKCEECGMSFISINKLGDHYRAYHKNSDVKTKDNIPQKGTTTCDMCGEYFPKRSMLVLHYYYVHNYDPFNKTKCEECGLSFNRIKKLKNHYRVHHPNKLKEDPDTVKTTDDIPIRTTLCHICGENFPKRGMLVEHYYRAHDYVPAKNKKCEDCGKLLRNNKKLTEHYRVVHPNKLIFCDVCSTGFQKIKDMQKHYEKVHVGKSYREWYTPTFGNATNNETSSMKDTKDFANVTVKSEPIEFDE